MATGVLGTAARQDPRQVSNTLKKTINWNDVAVGVPVPFANYLPGGAYIINVSVDVTIAFTGTTPTVTVGTNPATYNNIVASGDVTWTAAAVTGPVTRGNGRQLTAPVVGGVQVPADVLPQVMLGGTPTAGQAIIMIEFEGGWQS